MLIAVFRHGHKSFSADFDPDLSPKGFDQAQHLAKMIEKKELPEPTHLWASPKKRTSQTLQHAAELKKVPIHVRHELDTRSSNETYTQYKIRIQNFINDITERCKDSEVHFVCSHYDWIEDFLLLVDCNQDLNTPVFSHWAPGEFMIFDIIDGIWNVQKKGVIL